MSASEPLAPSIAEVQLVVMDMAGTTVQDRGEVPAAFRAALASHGVALTDDEIAQVRGASKREVIRGLLADHRPDAPAAAADEAYERFRANLAERYRAGAQAVPGVEDTVRWLRGRGIRVALNTGFDRDITGLLLDALGWAEGMVDAVVCGDDVRAGRPAPYLIFRAMEVTGATSVHRVMNLGDTELDLLAGWNAGVAWNVGVLSGAHPRERLERAPHTHLIASVASLPDLW
ncbi:MAG TPA: phosphonatase-like hydrolase [Longimicrobium sp.]|nr:phosphonatase-like hydrolase [Longimicrobium sp.]